MRDALAERGLGLRPQHLCQGPWSIGFGRASLRAILAAPPRPTAVICGNDWLAVGAMLEACEDAARKVARLLGDLETYVSGQSDIIIDYATARRREEPISTAITTMTGVKRQVHAAEIAPFAVSREEADARMALYNNTAYGNGAAGQKPSSARSNAWASPIRSACTGPTRTSSPAACCSAC